MVRACLWYTPAYGTPLLQGDLLGQEGVLVRLWMETGCEVREPDPGPVPPLAFHLWHLRPLDSALMFGCALPPPLPPPGLLHQLSCSKITQLPALSLPP